MGSNDLYNDRALFLRIAEGEEAAFTAFYEAVLPTLNGFAFKLLKSDDALEEVLQESLLRLWLNRDTLPEVEFPRSWFFKIVSNECFRYLKRNSLNSRLLENFGRQDAAVSDRVTEQQVSFHETQRLVQEAVQVLSARQQDIYRLSREHGLKIPEIAQRLGVSANYVKKTLSVALGKIREHLRRAGRFLAILLLW